MRYKSTRGGDAGSSFEHVLFSAYASDGGLYVPESIPMLKADVLRSMKNDTLSKVTGLVLSLFTDVPRSEYAIWQQELLLHSTVVLIHLYLCAGWI